MHQETISYTVDGHEYLGECVRPANSSGQKNPAIVVAHAWMGRDSFAVQKARDLAELGYVAFAADLYGSGRVVQTPAEASELMAPLFLDRKLLQKRIGAAYEVLKNDASVDATRIGGIGFCFGGLTIIELLRSGVPVRGAVSFHAVLGNKLGGRQAETVPIAKNIRGSLLILHGYDDPLVSSGDILAMQKDLNDAGVDWQMDVYGHTSHAFTNPAAHDQKNGLIFNPRSNDRSWSAMKNFFAEIL